MKKAFISLAVLLVSACGADEASKRTKKENAPEAGHSGQSTAEDPETSAEIPKLDQKKQREIPATEDGAHEFNCVFVDDNRLHIMVFNQEKGIAHALLEKFRHDPDSGYSDANGTPLGKYDNGYPFKVTVYPSERVVVLKSDLGSTPIEERFGY